MKELNQNNNAAIVLGQKYAFATVALVLAIGSFVSLLGMEKSILAIIFAWLALRSEPAPPLADRRRWGKVAIALGILHVVLMPTLILLNLDKIRTLLQLLITLQEGK
ncbi:MAG: hypothetical protein KF868_10800 [Acidobacteria bacterium]|nr:hypothetical protein [Acidobacteriota bacterium]MCW5969072.1 hypothetical protein [Blastocatellales bacterium]